MRHAFGYAGKTVPILLIVASTHLSGDNDTLVRAFSTNLPRVRRLDRSTAFNPARKLPYHSNTGYAQSYRRKGDTRLYSSIGAIPMSWLYLTLLAIQFGCQPLLTKAFAPANIVRSTVILAQDVVRFLTCCILLFLSGSWESAIQNWTVQGAFLGAGIPSVLYLVQNYCALMAYQNLPPVTFNVLNQTKTLSAALCCFLIMGRRQSPMQIISLVMLLFSALVVEKVVPVTGWWRKDEATNNSVPDDVAKEKAKNDQLLYMGVIPVLAASSISGLGMCQEARGMNHCVVAGDVLTRYSIPPL
jgi:hypothetical protein